MNGMVVHTWPVMHSQYAEILPNGNLLVDNYGYGLQELTPLGEQVWSWEGRYHHDFHVVNDEEIVFLINRDDPILPGFYAKGYEPESMLSDVVIAINRKGEVLWEFPFRDHVQELHELAGLPLPVRYAIRDERFRAGNILFSFRSLDIIGVADPQKNEIVWAWGLGVLDGQHQPTMTAKGTILMFDNGTARGYSAVVEIDPSTNQEIWRYEDRAGFFSAYRSGVQRLPNGNTLVAESDAGRIFELAPDKEVVWDYYSPFLGQGPGTQGRHVYRATRYTHEQVEPVFEARRDEAVVSVAYANHTRVRTFPEALRFYRDGLGG